MIHSNISGPRQPGGQDQSQLTHPCPFLVVTTAVAATVSAAVVTTPAKAASALVSASATLTMITGHDSDRVTNASTTTNMALTAAERTLQPRSRAWPPRPPHWPLTRCSFFHNLGCRSQQIGHCRQLPLPRPWPRPWPPRPTCHTNRHDHDPGYHGKCRDRHDSSNLGHGCQVLREPTATPTRLVTTTTTVMTLAATVLSTTLANAADELGSRGQRLDHRVSVTLGPVLWPCSHNARRRRHNCGRRDQPMGPRARSQPGPRHVALAATSASAATVAAARDGGRDVRSRRPTSPSHTTGEGPFQKTANSLLADEATGRQPPGNRLPCQAVPSPGPIAAPSPPDRGDLLSFPTRGTPAWPRFPRLARKEGRRECRRHAPSTRQSRRRRAPSPSSVSRSFPSRAIRWRGPGQGDAAEAPVLEESRHIAAFAP